MSRIPKKLTDKKDVKATKALDPDFVPARYDAQGRPRKTNRRAAFSRPRQTVVKDEKDLARLTAKWYEYLKHKGFKDIEWFDLRTGKGQNSGYLLGGKPHYTLNTGEDLETGVTAGLINYSDGPAHRAETRQLYYSMCRNYLTHSSQRTFKNREVKKMFRLHTEGYSYREIARIMETSGTYYRIFTQLKPVIADMLKWNKEDREGLLNPAQTDFYAEDALLADVEEGEC